MNTIRITKTYCGNCHQHCLVASPIAWSTFFTSPTFCRRPQSVFVLACHPPTWRDTNPKTYLSHFFLDRRRHSIKMYICVFLSCYIHQLNSRFLCWCVSVPTTPFQNPIFSQFYSWKYTKIWGLQWWQNLGVIGWQNLCMHYLSCLINSAQWNTIQT